MIAALHAGMRRGELLALIRKDIDFKARLIRVEQSKNVEKWSIPMSQTLYDTLKAIKVKDILRHGVSGVNKEREVRLRQGLGEDRDHRFSLP